MPRRLSGFVYVTGPDGATVGFGPDDDVPDWAAAKITNPKAWMEDDPIDAPTSTDPVQRLAGVGATAEELDVVRAMIEDLSDEERAELSTQAADPSDEELREQLTEWRRLTDENGGDLAAAFEQLAEANDDPPGAVDVSSPPPRSGIGSGRDAWAAYARAHEFDIADGARREDIIAALEAAGIPTE
jgi:hypothetical protein